MHSRFVGAVVLGLPFARSGGGDDSGDESASTATAQSTSADTELGNVTSEPVTLNVRTSDTGDGPDGPPGLRDVVATFEEMYPNIDVNLTAYDHATLFGPRLRTAMAAREGVDVVSMYGDGFVQSSNYQQALRPLWDLITLEHREGLTLVDQWERIDPSLHALPYGTYAYIWYDNRSMFEEAGLDPESPPPDWDGLLDACAKLKAAGITPIAAGFRDGFLGEWFHSWGFASQLFSADELTDFAQHEIDWTDPDHLDSLTRIQQLAEDGCFGENPEAGLLTESQEDFRGERAAMLYYLSIPGMELEEDLGEGNVGAFPMPVLPGSEYVAQTMDVGASSGWAITRFNPDVCREAWEFISFALSAEGQETRLTVDGTLPNHRAVTGAGDTDLDAQLLEWLGNPDNHSGPGTSAQESTVGYRQYPALVSGRVSPEEFAAEMQTARDESPQREEFERVDAEPCK